jgi:hypothetical protein
MVVRHQHPPVHCQLGQLGRRSSFKAHANGAVVYCIMLCCAGVWGIRVTGPKAASSQPFVGIVDCGAHGIHVWACC